MLQEQWQSILEGFVFGELGIDLSEFENLLSVGCELSQVRHTLRLCYVHTPDNSEIAHSVYLALLEQLASDGYAGASVQLNSAITSLESEESGVFSTEVTEISIDFNTDRFSGSPDDEDTAADEGEPWHGIVIMRDENAWCALFGEDLQVGLSGFGKSPELALHDLWTKHPELLDHPYAIEESEET